MADELTVGVWALATALEAGSKYVKDSSIPGAPKQPKAGPLYVFSA